MNDQRNQVWTEFGADYHLGHGPLRSCVLVWQELGSHTWQIWIIFKAGFAATFRQKIFGIAWGFVMPLVPLLAFFFLTLLRVFPTHETIHPLTYMAVGTTLWLYLHGLVVAPAAAVQKHASVLKSSGFPMICLFAASYGRLAFDMAVRIAAITPFLLVLDNVSVRGLMALAALLIPASAFAMALGILLGLGGAVLKDLENVVDIILRYLVFVSFAIFPISREGLGWWLYTFNPFAIFIDNLRNVLVVGNLATPWHLGLVSVFAIVLLVSVLHLYSVLERRVAGAL